MVAKCANPHCGTPFRYLNQGRLFHLPVRRSKDRPSESGVEHFWLCEACAARLTLKTEGRRIAVVDGGSAGQAIFQGGTSGGGA